MRDIGPGYEIARRPPPGAVYPVGAAAMDGGEVRRPAAAADYGAPDAGQPIPADNPVAPPPGRTPPPGTIYRKPVPRPEQGAADRPTPRPMPGGPPADHTPAGESGEAHIAPPSIEIRQAGTLQVVINRRHPNQGAVNTLVRGIEAGNSPAMVPVSKPYEGQPLQPALDDGPHRFAVNDLVAPTLFAKTDNLSAYPEVRAVDGREAFKETTKHQEIAGLVDSAAGRAIADAHHVTFEVVQPLVTTTDQDTNRKTAYFEWRAAVVPPDDPQADYSSFIDERLRAMRALDDLSALATAQGFTLADYGEHQVNVGRDEHGGTLLRLFDLQGWHHTPQGIRVNDAIQAMLAEGRTDGIRPMWSIQHTPVQGRPPFRLRPERIVDGAPDPAHGDALYPNSELPQLVTGVLGDIQAEVQQWGRPLEHTDAAGKVTRTYAHSGTMAPYGEYFSFVAQLLYPDGEAEQPIAGNFTSLEYAQGVTTESYFQAEAGPTNRGEPRLYADVRIGLQDVVGLRNTGRTAALCTRILRESRLLDSGGL